MFHEGGLDQTIHQRGRSKAVLHPHPRTKTTIQDSRTGFQQSAVGLLITERTDEPSEKGQRNLNHKEKRVRIFQNQTSRSQIRLV
ncbi:hypothetical protein JTE90_013985 [Oedothorax gibbosus]|uniref:Uncharacterized protein n=1 Tax=Oedothorax gibbosus TaxID=931172 RepID=A0AAV6UCF6_9ARAC|nr:hypothetical protein JTE90_013985 [Oedothorax gibbosus]